MATASELGGRRTPTAPAPKGDKTVTFVGSDGNEIEVLSSISKGALRVLKKQGYRKQSDVLKEQEDAALAKGGLDADEDEDEVPNEDWTRKDIDAWAARQDPPIDVSEAGTKAEAVALINEALEEDTSDDS